MGLFSLFQGEPATSPTRREDHRQDGWSYTVSRDGLPGRDSVVLVLMVAWSSLMTALAVLRGIRHDYVAYLEQWRLIREGADPWAGSNTYGPLHNLLAYLAIPADLGPKVFLTIAFVVINFLLVMLLLDSGPSAASLLAYAILVPLNFLVIGVVFSFGLNDALSAALIGLAVLARFRKWIVACGVFLGLAVLLKYYPALLIPFFCLNDRRFNWRLLLASVGTVTIGFFAAWVVWGAGFTAALSTGATRAPKLLSILSALERNQTLGPDSALLGALIQANALAVIAICLVALILAYRMRLSWIEGASVASLAYLLVYKVGHQQFYIPWLVLVVGLLILGTSRSKAMAYVSLPYVVFLAAFQFGYEVVTDGYNSIGGFVRDDVGFVAFALGSLTILLMLVSAARISADADDYSEARSPSEPSA